MNWLNREIPLEFIPYMDNPDIMAVPFVATGDYRLVGLKARVREAVAKRNELDNIRSGHGINSGDKEALAWASRTD